MSDNGSHPAQRVLAIDAARGFSIFAMIIAHTVVFVRPDLPRLGNVAAGQLNDLASPLFAMIIGVTVGYQLRQAASWRWPGCVVFSAQFALKGVILIVLGFALEARFSGINIVLDYLGVAMLVAVPLLFAPGWLIAAVAAVVAVASATLNAIARDWALRNPLVAYDRDGIAHYLLDWTVLGGSYRLTGLLPLLLLGILLARWQLGRPRRTALITGLGAALYLGAFLWRDAEELRGLAVSGSYADLCRDVGLALLSYGAISLIVDANPPRLRRVARLLAHPLVAMGTMALSIYCLHVVVLMGVWATPIGMGPEPWRGGVRGWSVLVAVLLLCAAFAMLWSRFLGTGPVERIVGVVTARHPPRSLLARRGAGSTIDARRRDRVAVSAANDGTG